MTDEALASAIRDRMRSALPGSAVPGLTVPDPALPDPAIPGSAVTGPAEVPQEPLDGSHPLAPAPRSPEIARFHTLLHDYPGRTGKMLRGRIVIQSTLAHGGTTEPAAMTVAAALELFQAWVLVHDDIEDGSETRRGLPALHRLVGMPVALNVGDALHVYMWRLLHELLTLPSVDAKSVLDEFGAMITRTAEGQHLDLSFVQDGRFDIGEDAYLEMVTLKTAHYTVASPLRLGALLAGIEPDPALAAAGIELGVAFQIRDDVLNLRPDTSVDAQYGKEFAGDLYEGKRTLIIAHLLATASSDDADEVTLLLSGPRSARTPESVARLLRLIDRYGSLDHAQAVADACAAAGLTAITAVTDTLPRQDAVARLLALLAPLAARSA